MKILKKRALELIDEKITQLYRVLEKATYENRYNEEYNLAYYGTKTLVTELFSKDEAQIFTHSVIAPFGLFGGNTEEKVLEYYKNQIRFCISQLKVYKERISDFWVDEGKTEKLIAKVPFLSKSFDERDKDINGYIANILKALNIEFETGERYSKDNIPTKVLSRIESSGTFIIVFVKDERIEGGGYTTPSWLLKELGIAQGCKKEVIAWVEKGIKDIANLNYEKEVIYFDRENLADMEKATTKFLEALKEHSLT